MLETLLVKAYSIPHKLSINNFINDYMILLNKILNDIRQSNRMEEERKKLIPFIRKDFQKIYYKMQLDLYHNTPLAQFAGVEQEQI
jgi:hypothetical protein